MSSSIENLHENAFFCENQKTRRGSGTLMNWDQNYRALVHFEGARDLYCASGQASEWQSLVGTVRMAHSRKSGFLSGFETDCVPQAAPFLHLRRRGTGAVETVDFLK